MPRIIASTGINSLVDVGALNAFQSAITMFEPRDLFATIGTVIATNRNEARLPWLWFPPRMREWSGERQQGTLQGSIYSISVNTYENTITIPRTVVEDQMVPLIEQRVREMAAEYFHFLHRTYISILQDGAAINTFDGQPLLTSNPATRGANNVNLITGSGAVLSVASLSAGLAAMQGYTDPEGRPLAIAPTHLLVGPKSEFIARSLVQSTTLIASGGGSANVMGSANPFADRLEVVVSPYIADDDWYLVAAGANAYRPVVRVDRTDLAIEFTARTQPTDEPVFRFDSYQYGMRVRHGFGAGAWYAVYAAQPS